MDSYAIEDASGKTGGAENPCGEWRPCFGKQNTVHMSCDALKGMAHWNKVENRSFKTIQTATGCLVSVAQIR